MINNYAEPKLLNNHFVRKYNPRTRSLTPHRQREITTNHSNKRCKINKRERKDETLICPTFFMSVVKRSLFLVTL